MSDGLTDAYKVLVPKIKPKLKHWNTKITKLEDFICTRKSRGIGKQCH